MEWYSSMLGGSRMNNCFLLSAHDAWFRGGEPCTNHASVTVDNRVVEGLTMHGLLTGNIVHVHLVISWLLPCWC